MLVSRPIGLLLCSSQADTLKCVRGHQLSWMGQHHGLQPPKCVEFLLRDALFSLSTGSSAFDRIPVRLTGINGSKPSQVTRSRQLKLEGKFCLALVTCTCVLRHSKLRFTLLQREITSSRALAWVVGCLETSFPDFPLTVLAPPNSSETTPPAPDNRGGASAGGAAPWIS